MNRKYTNRSYLDAMEKKVLVFDGGRLSGAEATCSIHGSPFGAEHPSPLQWTFMN